MINKENLGVKLFMIAFPVIIQNLVQYIQVQIDMSMLGHYNPIFLSALGNVIYPYIVLFTFLGAISLGATVQISHCIGQKSLSRAKRYGEVSFFYNVALSILSFILLYYSANTIMNLMGTTADVNFYGVQYMKMLSFSLIFLGVELSIVAILQGMGITRHIMFAGIARTLLNIFFDWVLIYGNLGFAEMGIEGAAIATSIANAGAAIYFVIAFILSKKLLFKTTLAGILKPKWRIQKSNIKIGLPNGLEAILWSLGQIGIIRIVNEVDDLSAGIYILITRIQAVTFFFYLGIARATITLVAQKMGAGQLKEAKHVGSISLKISLIICVIAAAFFVLIPDKILQLFTNEQSIISGATNFMYWIAIIIFPVTINVIIGNAIRGLKDTKWMFYTQFFGTIITVCCSAIFVLGFKVGLIGVFVTVLIDESLRALLNYFRFYWGRGFISKFIGAKANTKFL